MKNLIKIISVISLALLYAVNFASASITGGEISTGINTGIGGTVIVNPTASVPSGTYTSVQNVSLAAIGSLSVHYTTSGTAPTCLTPSTYSAPIIISATSTLKAIACYANSVTSNISTYDYVINLPPYAPPIASPLAGTYTSAQSVVLSATGSTSIRYTIDESMPTCSVGNVYASAIAVGASQTIKAIACYDGGNFSDVASFAYAINIPSGGGGGGGGGTPPPATKTGDINSDSKVDKYDFAMLMASWGQTGSNSSDLNHDNKVDKYDFALLMLNWGK